jgi:multidrug efflux system outer membrane protein
MKCRDWICALIATTALIGACTVGPRYQRPGLQVPAAFRGAQDTVRAVSLGEAKWSEVFRDTVLQELIGRALQQNYDIHIAAARVAQAQALLRIRRADQFPFVIGSATARRERIPERRQGSTVIPPITDNLFDINLMLSWEIDFWGKFRSGTEAERANLLSTAWAARAVLTSVISLVADGYFQLRELDLELEIARRTLAARQESLDLTRVQEAGGVASLLDVRQAEQLVYSAQTVITNTEQLIEQQENALSVLLGQNPRPIPRGLTIIEQPTPPEIPAGLPARLLERRPDIRQAEYALIAANAEIGVAKAALFPAIALTAIGGKESNTLARLVQAPATYWSVAAGLVQQIFNAGRLRAQVRLTEAQKEELVYAYLRTVQQAFGEVSDALVAYQKAREFRAQQTLLVSATQDAARLSDIRYRGGVSSYIEVLISQAAYFNSELDLAQARLDELSALVQCYRALGGGWAN